MTTILPTSAKWYASQYFLSALIIALCVIWAAVGCYAGFNNGYAEGQRSIECPACEQCVACTECTHETLLTVEEAIETTPTATDKETLRELCRRESGCKHLKVKIVTGKAGEVGTGQILPSTAEHFNCGDTTGLRANIICMSRKFQYCLEKTKGNRKAAFCCYNGSPVDKNGTCAYYER